MDIGLGSKIIAVIAILIVGVYMYSDGSTVNLGAPTGQWAEFNANLDAVGYSGQGRNPNWQPTETEMRDVYKHVFGSELVAWQTADGTEMCPQLPTGGRTACIEHWEQEYNNASENAVDVIEALRERIPQGMSNNERVAYVETKESINWGYLFSSLFTQALAAVEFSDAFTESGVVFLTESTPDTGTGWATTTTTGSACILVINGARGTLYGASSADYGCGASNGVIYEETDALSNSDYTASITQTNGDTGDDDNQLCARIQDGDNMYCFVFNEGAGGPQGDLYSVTTASGWTEISADCGHIADGSVVDLIVTGTTISVEDDSTEICSVTNSDHSSAGAAGVGMGASGAGSTGDVSFQELDDFSIDVAAAASPATNRQETFWFQ